MERVQSFHQKPSYSTGAANRFRPVLAATNVKPETNVLACKQAANTPLEKVEADWPCRHQSPRIDSEPPRNSPRGGQTIIFSRHCDFWPGFDRAVARLYSWAASERALVVLCWLSIASLSCCHRIRMRCYRTIRILRICGSGTCLRQRQCIVSSFSLRERNPKKSENWFVSKR